MVDYSSTSIPKPKNWQDFERASRVLFECILNDRHVQNNGRQGQEQHGADIYGRVGGEGTKWIGIQCKGKRDGYGSKVTKAELRKEVQEARKFKPALSEFILITTANNDVVIQEEARLITQENEVNGVPFTVVVYGWEELESRINEHPRALKAFHPDVTPFTDGITDSLNRIDIRTEAQDTTLGVALKYLQSIAESQQASAHDGTSAVNEAVDKHLHAEIDGYRDLLKQGKYNTALNFLESLKARVWESASDRIKFRITTNIGAAKGDLGKRDEAKEYLLEAIKYQPEDKTALANVVLAHILSDNKPEAIKAANIALQKDATNATAASYLIQINSTNQAIDDPLSIIPQECVDTLPVAIAQIAFYRTRNSEKWKAIALDSLQKYPDDIHIRRAAAESELDNALNTKGLLVGQVPIVPVNYERLRESAKTLQELWDKECADDHPTCDSSLPNNLSQTYRALGDKSEALKVINKGIEKFPDAKELFKLRAGFYIEANQPKEAISILEKAEGDPEAALLIAEIELQQNPDKALQALEKVDADKLPLGQNVMAKHLHVEALLKLKKNEEAIKVAEDFLQKYPADALAHTVLAFAQEILGDTQAAVKTLKNAKSFVDENTSFYDRFILATRFESLELFSDAADMLNGHVSHANDSPALRTLLFSLIYGDRRKEAHDLLTALPQWLAETPLYLKAAVALHFRRGDYGSAESAIVKYLKLHPEDLKMNLHHIDILSRRRDDSGIERLFDKNLEELKGEPEDLMRLVQWLDRFHFHERALKLAYKTQISCHENADIQLGYIVLLLRPGFSQEINLERTQVAVDNAITIRNGEGIVETYIIEPDKDLRISQDFIAPEHALAQKASNLIVGQKFRINDSNNPEDEWEIISIKHKYLHALHQKMERFKRQYPDATGLQNFRVSDTDKSSFNVVLSKVKERHDSIDFVLNNYAQTPLPYEIFAQYLGGDVIEAWHCLRQMGRRFKACIGNSPERDAAFQAIKINKKAGCVVDALTLRIIREFEIENAIVGVCGRIGATESTINVFRQRREKILAHGNQGFMTLFWKDGQYFREEVSAEQIKEAEKIADGELEWITKNVDILPAESAFPLTDNAIQIKEALNIAFLDPLLAAKNANRLLLCEDQSYRQFSAQEASLRTSWIQPVLTIARDKKIITQNEFSEAVCKLVEANHYFTSIDSQTLLYAMECENNAEKRFLLMATTLFAEDAEIQSHYNVLSGFLVGAWKVQNRPLSVSAERATGIVLERLFMGEWQKKLPRNMAVQILNEISDKLVRFNPRLTNYILNWLKGHFLIAQDSSSPDIKFAATALPQSPKNKKKSKDKKRGKAK